MDIFKRFLKGEVSLGVTFWVFGVLGSIAISMPKLFVFVGAIASEVLNDRENVFAVLTDPETYILKALETPELLAVVVVELLYAIYVSIAIWNASNVYRDEKQGDTVWPILAKVAIFFSWLQYVASYVQAWQVA